MTGRIVRALACLILAGSIHSARAQFAGGDGGPGNPYQIATAAQLAHIDDLAVYYSNHFILVANIDVTDTSTNYPLFPRQDQGGRSDGIGTFGGSFTFGGSLDGNGFAVLNLTNSFLDGGRPPYGGEPGVVKNLILSNVNIRPHHLVYDNQGRGYAALYPTDNNNTPGMRFISCHASGIISNDNNQYVTGGLFGNCPNIYASNCTSSVTVYGRGNVGGLFGVAGDTVTVCSASGDVWGDNPNVGGLIGSMGGSFIYRCFATGNITHTNRCYAGGLIGVISGGGTVRECLATGDIDHHIEAGGLVGGTVGGVSNMVIEDCYATGNLTGDYAGDRAGGLMGEYGRFASGHLINRCYSKGDVSAPAAAGFAGESSSGGSMISNAYASGGTIANSSAGFTLPAQSGSTTVGNCYWTNSATSDAFATQVVNEAYFYKSSNPPLDSWDNVNVWYIGGKSDPCLRWHADCNPPPAGTILQIF